MEKFRSRIQKDSYALQFCSKCKVLLWNGNASKRKSGRLAGRYAAYCNDCARDVRLYWQYQCLTSKQIEKKIEEYKHRIELLEKALKGGD